MADIQQTVTRLRGVNEATAAKLANLGLRNQFDLIFHFPFRYQDRTHLTPINQLEHGQEALVQARIIESKLIFYGKKGLQLIIQDQDGEVMLLRFFYHSFGLKKSMKVGAELRCYGTARYNQAGQVEMIHPECSLISHTTPLELGLTPVYHLTQGISQRKMRQLVSQALNKVSEADLPNLLDEDDIIAAGGKASGYSTLAAVKLIHSPPPDSNWQLLLEGSHPAQYKLGLEELCANRLYLLRDKLNSTANLAPALPAAAKAWEEFAKTLPFVWTQGQQQACAVIGADLAQEQQMVRLLQGDVGCGKTLVAAYAALQAQAAGWQTAIMAPTEILAEQHLNQFTEWFLPLGIRVVPLLGKMGAKEKRTNQQLIENGEADLIIGTHALIQQRVKFAKLGLIVIDEQQRFGVKQRHLLQEKGLEQNMHPHQLIMTATPIPRTLAQTLLANMDITSIQELPPGRIPCKTSLLSSSKRRQLVERLKPQLAEGNQLYWVCPLIEESEVIEAENVHDIHKQLQQLLPDYKLAIAHGRQKAKDKVAAMHSFKKGDYQILIATSVIEVGVDVPQANFMVIENAERLGLSQLHQLRGRVGRGSARSFCMLLFNEPLSETAKERLQAMVKTNSGFEIAEADMRLRGVGDIIGTQQSGAMQFRMANLFRHPGIVTQSETLCKRMLQMPEDHQQSLISRWIDEEASFGAV